MQALNELAKPGKGKWSVRLERSVHTNGPAVEDVIWDHIGDCLMRHYNVDGLGIAYGDLIDRLPTKKALLKILRGRA